MGKAVVSQIGPATISHVQDHELSIKAVEMRKHAQQFNKAASFEITDEPALKIQNLLNPFEKIIGTPASPHATAQVCEVLQTLDKNTLERVIDRFGGMTGFEKYVYSQTLSKEGTKRILEAAASSSLEPVSISRPTTSPCVLTLEKTSLEKANDSPPNQPTQIYRLNSSFNTGALDR